MTIKFNSDYLEELAKDNAKGKPKYAQAIVIKFKKTLKILQYVPNTTALWTINSLGFEALKGIGKGYFSVRVDYHFRLIFKIEEDRLTHSETIIIHELTNHYQ